MLGHAKLKMRLYDSHGYIVYYLVITLVRAGVTWFEVDLESKKVVVKGDVTPLEVLQSVSKVKFAQLWMAGPGPIVAS